MSSSGNLWWQRWREPFLYCSIHPVSTSLHIYKRQVRRARKGKEFEFERKLYSFQIKPNFCSLFSRHHVSAHCRGHSFIFFSPSDHLECWCNDFFCENIQVHGVLLQREKEAFLVQIYRYLLFLVTGSVKNRWVGIDSVTHHLQPNWWETTASCKRNASVIVNMVVRSLMLFWDMGVFFSFYNLSLFFQKARTIKR